MTTGLWKIVGSLGVAAVLAACSGTEGPPQPVSLNDNTCAQLRADLTSMDRRGVPALVDSRVAGKKLAPAQDAEASRYNQVLDQYLGGQCASEVRYKQKAGIPTAAPSRQSSVQTASVTTGSVGKTQVKRRKPLNDDDDAAPSGEKAEKAVYTEEPAKPAKRKTTSAKSKTAAAPPAPAAAAPAKSDSGLPSAPAPTPAAEEKKE